MQDEYLGDGLYAKFDGYGFELYASDGIDKISSVYLEPSTLDSFIQFAMKKGFRLQ